MAQECSNASLTGAYGYTVSGTVTTEGNKFIRNSEVGRVVFDGKGGLTAVAAITSGGKVEVGELKGEVAVGVDCTATGKLVYPGATLEFDMVVANAGSDFAIVVRSEQATLSGTGTKVESQGACTKESLKGTIAYQGEGTVGIDGKAVSQAEIGVVTFDGSGGVSGVLSNIAGGQSNRTEFKGVYDVTDICFGSFGYKVGDDTYQTNFMLTNNGNNMLYSEFGPRYVVTGWGARTFPK